MFQDWVVDSLRSGSYFCLAARKNGTGRRRIRFAKKRLGEKAVSQPDRNGLSGKCCEAASIDSGLNVTIPDPLQVDHRRRDIAVAHPLLERSDVNSIL